VMWFLGSLAMGLLYSRSLIGLALFGVASQLVAAMMFFTLRDKLPPAEKSA